MNFVRANWTKSSPPTKTYAVLMGPVAVCQGFEQAAALHLYEGELAYAIASFVLFGKLYHVPAATQDPETARNNYRVASENPTYAFNLILNHFRKLTLDERNTFFAKDA